MQKRIMFVHTDQRKTVKLPSHLRCSQRRVTIPTAKESGRSTVVYTSWVLSCPGWSAHKGTRALGMLWKAILANPQTREGFARCFSLNVENVPHRLILITSFSVGGTVLKTVKPLGGRGRWGSAFGFHSSAPLPICSRLVLTRCEGRKPGCMLFLPRCLLLSCSVFCERPCAFRPRAKQVLLPLNASVRLFCSSEKYN